MSLVPTNNQIEVGATNLGAGDFIPPRVKVVQQMAKEAADKKAEAGDFYNTLTGQNYGPSLTVVPLFTFQNRVFITRAGDRKKEADAKLVAAGLEPLPADADGLMCRSVDTVVGNGDPGIRCADCPLAQWEGRTGAPLCSETYNLVAITEEGDVVFIGMSKSSAKVGKRINSVLRMTTRSPWASMWKFTTTQESNTKGIFYVPDFTAHVEQTPPELMGEAARFARMFAGAPIDVTEDAAQEEAPATDLPF